MEKNNKGLGELSGLLVAAIVISLLLTSGGTFIDSFLDSNGLNTTNVTGFSEINQTTELVNQYAANTSDSTIDVSDETGSSFIAIIATGTLSTLRSMFDIKDVYFRVSTSFAKVLRIEDQGGYVSNSIKLIITIIIAFAVIAAIAKVKL